MTRFGNSCDGHCQSKSAVAAEETNLLKWFDLHQSLINATADILKDAIDVVKRRKITPHISILREENNRAVIVISRSILSGFRDAISNAVKGLNNQEFQMCEELRDRFNLPEDWLESGSLAPSVAGSEINGPTFSRNISSEYRSRLSLLLDNDRNMNLSKEPSEPNPTDLTKTENLRTPGKNTITRDEDEIANSDVHNLPDGTSTSNDTIREDNPTPTPNHVEKEVPTNPETNQDKPPQLEENQTTNSNSPIPGTSFVSYPAANGSPDPAIPMPRRSNDSNSDSDGSGKTCIAPTKSNLFLGMSLRKSIKKEIGERQKSGGPGSKHPLGVKDMSSVALLQIKKERLERSESHQIPRDESVSVSDENGSTIDNPPMSNPGLPLPPNHADTFRVKKINLKVDLDDTRTLVVNRTPRKSTPVKVSRDERNPEAVEKEAMATPPPALAEVGEPAIVVEDNNPDSLSQSLLADGSGDIIEETIGLNPSEMSTNQQPLPGPSSSSKDKNKKLTMSKLEQVAMRGVLSSSSDSEADPHRNNQRKPRKNEVKRDDISVSASVASPERPRMDRKLEGVVTVAIEKLAPCIEKGLLRDGYVRLKHFRTLKKLGGRGQLNESSDSDSSCESDDSLANYRAQLKDLQRSAIVRSVKYNEKRGVQPKSSRTKRAKAKWKDNQIFNRICSGSESESRLTEVGDDSAGEEFTRNSRSNANDDVVSCSGSDDLDHQSDENRLRKSRPPSNAAAVSKQRKDGNKKKRYVTLSSSGSEGENMKAVLGSDSESDVPRIPRQQPSNDSDSDPDEAEKPSRKRRRIKSDSTSEITSSSDWDSDSRASKNNRKKKRRQVVVTIGSDSSNKSASEEDSDIQVISQDEEPSQSQGGRKNIRKIMSSKELRFATREAEKTEEERRKRLADKQNLFNGLHKVPETDKLKRLILDGDPETNEPFIEVDQAIVDKLKPHQAEGIKFMYDACFESLEMIKENKVPGGCILAHCMGLGKTLQTVAFLHTLITNKVCGIKTALVICPLSTINNWYKEIRQWTRDSKGDVGIHKIFEAKNTINDRKDHLRGWHRRGGIGLLHYDIFRRLVDPKEKSNMSESDRQVIKETLLDPGPDIVICDEGHLLKNCKSMLSLAVNNIKTLRRIVLTGTPLQNNLTEYHTMMNFVKPSLLGSLQEFTNRFANPIKNGQHADSTDNDVKTMKRRAHVLHRKLEGCVQRRDFSILAPYLPPKYEYIINIKLSERQETLYKHYLQQVVDPNPVTKRKNLLKYYAELVKVWSHPSALIKRKDKDDDEEANLGESGNTSDSMPGNPVNPQNGDPAGNDPEAGTSNQGVPEPGVAGEWWTTIFKTRSEISDFDISGKLLVLQEILKTSESIGDKVLVFSQFLSSLDIIEEFLAKWDKEAEKRRQNSLSTFPLSDICGSDDRWRLNVEYFRIDGQRKVSDRQKDCEKFNKKSYSKAKLFLISTRAGGLGINLFGANRVVIFDASWNPSQDTQSIFRVFRFGQDKPCYIYRLISRGTMEEKILRRQITKLSLSSRVVDEHQIERHFKFDDVNDMLRYDEEDPNSQEQVLAVPKDRLLADLLITHKNLISSYEEFDSLLENKPDEELSNEEKELAWDEYRRESENQRRDVPAQRLDMMTKFKERFRQLHPSATQSQIEQASSTTVNVIRKIQEWSLIQTKLTNAGITTELTEFIEPLKAWVGSELSEHPQAEEDASEQNITRPLPSIFNVPAQIQSLPVQIQTQLAQARPNRSRANNNNSAPQREAATQRRQLQNNHTKATTSPQRDPS